MKKVTRWLLALVCIVIGLTFVACGKSSDTSLYLLTIDGVVISEDMNVTLNKDQWAEWQTKDLLAELDTQYELADKARVEYVVNTTENKIHFIVTAEDGTKKTTDVSVYVRSDDTSLTVTSINGAPVTTTATGSEVTASSADWAAWCEAATVESVHTVAPTSSVDVTLDKVFGTVKYKVTAEDGTTKTYTVSVDVRDEIEETDLFFTGSDGLGNTATSYWSASYGEKGITVKVNVIDDYIYVADGNIGYRDNVEFIIGPAKKGHIVNENGDYKVLVAADGNYFFQKANATLQGADFGPANDVVLGVNDNVTSSTHNFTAIGERAKFFLNGEKKEGYRVEVFIKYSLIGQTYASAKDNLTICPAMRNMTNAGTDIGKAWTPYSGNGCVWGKSSFYLSMTQGEEESITFARGQFATNVDYLFIGDSWINTAFWKDFDIDFGAYNAVNIGFGGAHTQQVTAKVDEIAGFNPKNIIVRTGTNDINSGDNATVAAQEVVTMLDAMHAAMPEAKIYFLSIDPCIGHTENGLRNWNTLTTANASIKADIETNRAAYATYVNIVDKLITDDQQIYASTFREDNCHLSFGFGYGIYVKAIYEALNLPWNEGNVFGDNDLYAHTVGFVPDGNGGALCDAEYDQYVWFKDLIATEYYAEFSATATKAFNGEGYPKFGFSLNDGMNDIHLYVDACNGFTSQVVGAVRRNGNGSYLWGEQKPCADVTLSGLAYTGTSAVKLGVLRTNGNIYLFVNDNLALTFADSFGANSTAVGIFTFNMGLKVTNGSFTTDAAEIAAKIPA